MRTTDAGIVLLVRQPPLPLGSDTQYPVDRAACLLNDEPIRIYVPLHMRPWVVQACHSSASCHLGTARTLRMFLPVDRYEHLNAVVLTQLLEAPSTENIEANGPVAHHYVALSRRARHRRQHRVFRPSLGDASRKYYILLFSNRFSRRADMYAVTAAEFTAEGTANILINRYIPLWGCPRSILSGNGLQFCSKLSHAVYQLLGARKIDASSYHPSGNSGVERVNHTMAQMLAMVVNELQNNWDEQLPHVEFAYNNSVSAATGLAPNEVHMGRLPRLPLTIFERAGVAGHQSLARDHLAYCDLATDRQQRAYDILREHHALTVARMNRRNSALADALRPVPKLDFGG